VNSEYLVAGAAATGATTYTGADVAMTLISSGNLPTKAGMIEIFAFSSVKDIRATEPSFLFKLLARGYLHTAPNYGGDPATDL